MKYFVYIIQSEVDESYYVGHTNNLEDRLLRHNSERTRYASTKTPWKLVYSESCSSRSEAMTREKEIKAKKSSKYIKGLISQ